MHESDDDGSSPTAWGPDIAYLRIKPHWMVGYLHE
jgi:hypothetical protein